MGHNADDALVKDGQQHPAVDFLCLFDDAVVESHNDLQELIVGAHLSHELVEELKWPDYRLIITDLT